jgi:hypothetical protein
MDYELRHSKDEVVRDDFHPQSNYLSAQPSSRPPFGILEQSRIHGCRIAKDDFVDGADRVPVTFVRYKFTGRTCTCSLSEYNTLFTQQCHWTTWKKEIHWQ